MNKRKKEIAALQEENRRLREDLKNARLAAERWEICFNNCAKQAGILRTERDEYREALSSLRERIAILLRSTNQDAEIFNLPRYKFISVEMEGAPEI